MNYRRVFFSLDGRLLCMAGERKTAKVCNAETGEGLMAILSRFHTAVFSPDCGSLAGSPFRAVTNEPENDNPATNKRIYLEGHRHPSACGRPQLRRSDEKQPLPTYPCRSVVLLLQQPSKQKRAEPPHSRPRFGLVQTFWQGPLLLNSTLGFAVDVGQSPFTQELWWP
jgi:hypothetical protein